MKRLILCLSVLGMVASVQAATLAIDTFDSTNAWTVTDRPTRTGPYGTPSASGGTLQIQAADPASGGADQDLLFTTGDLVGGGVTNFNNWWNGTAYTNVASAQFNFYGGGSTSDLPSGLSVYFMSSNSVAWYYDVTPLAGWNTYAVNFQVGEGWYSPSHVDSFFTVDLNEVNEIGLLLTYQSFVGGQIYNLDNFMLMDTPIPEPETYVVLGFALLTLAVTFRRQLSASLVRVRALVGG